MIYHQIELSRRLVEKFGRTLWKPGMRIGAPNPLGTMRSGMTEPWSWTRLGEHDEEHGMCIERVTTSARPDLLDPATAFLLFEMASELHRLQFTGTVNEANVVNDDYDDLVSYRGHLGVVAARILLGLSAD